MWLGILATPTFAVMTVVTLMSGGDEMGMMCGGGLSSVSGMGGMYLLMSLFHRPRGWGSSALG
jgi:hypothetical protein